MSLFLTLDNIYSLYAIDPSFRTTGMAVIGPADRPIKEFSDYRHQFDGLLLTFMIQGKMTLRIHFLEYDICEGDAVIILPHLMVEPLQASADAQVITIGLSLDFISGFPILREFITNDQIRWQPVIRFEKDSQSLQRDFVLLLQQFYRKKTSAKKEEVLQYLLFALITSLSEAYLSLAYTKNLVKNRKHEIIDNFYVLLSKHANHYRNVKFYADALHLTPQYLTTLLKAETGKSVLQWIDHVAIMHAKSLLKSSNLSVKEISHILHFSDASLFCRYFKRKTGISPKTFRNI